MSSFIRRIERQQHPSRKIHPVKNSEGKFTGEYYADSPRKVFFKGRGSKLGVTNPKAKDLLARLAREKRNAERRASK